MKIIPLSILFSLSSLSIMAQGDDVFADRRQSWAYKAEAAKPRLTETVCHPLCVVKAISDKKAFQGWRYEKSDDIEKFYTANFKDVKEMTVDFGRHLTGRFSFHIRTLSNMQDAPIRLRFSFGEVPAELNVPLEPWRGLLPRSWMQEESITVEWPDQTVSLPRRMAFRYLKIENLGCSSSFNFAIDSLTFIAESAVDRPETKLESTCPDNVRQIYQVALNTLHECMQTVFEDGPKRDRRLWIGDLYLESLANHYSFRQYQLVKRCLYLLASVSKNDGVLISNLLERPYVQAQDNSVALTYSLLYNSCLLEYLKNTGDTETARDLWPVAKRQVEEALASVGDDGLYDVNKRPSWLFFDWREGLDVSSAMQAATVFALDQTCELAHLLGRESEVKAWPQKSAMMKKAAHERLYDKKSGLVVSGRNRQLSVLSQAWMIKAGILNKKEGRRAMCAVFNRGDAVRPGTPYATHYVVEALVLCGMREEARQYLINYWGGMVKKGADTFWEAYDPDDDFISPYRFHPVNSSCHAWSCTPIYFIHRYPGIFQK